MLRVSSQVLISIGIDTITLKKQMLKREQQTIVPLFLVHQIIQVLIMIYHLHQTHQDQDLLPHRQMCHLVDQTLVAKQAQTQLQ